MNLHELRIGNIFCMIGGPPDGIMLPQTGHPMQVITIGFASVEYLRCNVNPAMVEKWPTCTSRSMAPLRLNDAEILRMGFEVKNIVWNDGTINENVFVKRVKHYEYFIINTADGYCFGFKDAFKKPVWINQVNTVHGVQNLFFAVTNEEIQYNEK